MKAFVLVAACLVAVCLAGSSSDRFKHFKKQYNKVYANQQMEKFRKNAYLDNAKKIAMHNERYEKGEVTFKMSLNHFADMPQREFYDTFLGYNRSLKAHNKVLEGTPFVRPQVDVISREVDWRKKGAITPVKDQGHCGSCWAFSATGALEAHNFLKKGQLISLSEQNLVDCSSTYGNNGCNGGLMEQAFQYVKDNRGIDTERSYPYEGEDSDCRYKAVNIGATNKGYSTLTEGDEQELLEAVATVGPVSVAIDASDPSFQFYSEGVYYNPNCDSQNLDHGVLVVGYGEEDGLKYWIVKNSWGVGWGDQGYIKMARDRNNNCGIATEASFPLV